MPGTVILAALLFAAPAHPEQAKVLAVIDAAFAGIAAHDSKAVAAHLRETGTATVIMEKPDGTRTVRNVPLATYADVNPGTDTYEERMIDPQVQIDGAMASVWGPYTFATNGAIHHCGYQNFGLIQEAGIWKIQNVTWSVRFTGCAAK